MTKMDSSYILIKISDNVLKNQPLALLKKKLSNIRIFVLEYVRVQQTKKISTRYKEP